MRARSLNAKGSSLIELMVGIVILGVMTAGFMTMISNVTNSQKLAQSRQDMMGITQEMQTMFSSESICQRGLVAGTPFDFAKASVTYPPATGPFQFNGLPFKYKINGDVLQDNSFAQGQKTEALTTYSLTVKHLQIVNAGTVGVDTNGNPVYRGDFIGQFGPSNYTGQGLSDFSPRNMVSGFVSVANGTIASCSASGLSTLAQASLQYADICTGLGGTWDGTKCTLGSSTIIAKNPPTMPSMPSMPMVPTGGNEGHWVAIQTPSLCVGSAPAGKCKPGQLQSATGRQMVGNAPCQILYQCY